MGSDGVELTVYSRTYCHLCDDMICELTAMGQQLGFRLRVVDVDQDPALEQRYGELVPVLVGGDSEICHYHVDRPALDAYLAKIR